MLSLKQPAPSAGFAMPIPAAPPKPAGAATPPLLKSLPTLPEELNPFRRLAFYFGLACIFLRFSFLQEAISAGLHVNTYLLYFVAPVAIIGVVATGGIYRTFRSKAAISLGLFLFWMGVAVIFSSWQGGSLDRFKSYTQTDFFLLMVAAGLVVTWKDIRLVFHTLAFSGFTVLVVARLFLRSDQGRFSLDFGGTIANANDLATHVLLMVPFMIYVVMDKKAMTIMRILYLLMIPYSLYIVLGTASRGCFIALAVGSLFWFLRAPMKQKLMIVVLLPLLIAPALVLLPQQTFERLSTLKGEKNDEADESADSRRYLFFKGVEFTLAFPMFGVGPDQFSNFEGGQSRAAGRHGNWHETHCTWVQISSECGIPALIFFVGAIGAAFVMVNRCYKQAKQIKDEEMMLACFCYMMAFVLFFASTTFLSAGYTFRQPFLVGLAITMSYYMQRRMSQVSAAAGRPRVGPQNNLITR